MLTNANHDLCLKDRLIKSKYYESNRKKEIKPFEIPTRIESTIFRNFRTKNYQNLTREKEETI